MSKHYDFPVGAEVGVIRSSFSGTSNQGYYKVTKCNGTVCEVERISDGYKRSFSNRTGIERSCWSDRYNTAKIVSIDEYNQIEAEHAKRNIERSLWIDARKAAEARDIKVLKELVARLEECKC